MCIRIAHSRFYCALENWFLNTVGDLFYLKINTMFLKVLIQFFMQILNKNKLKYHLFPRWAQKF